MKSQFVNETLSNGLRIAMEVMPDTKSAACGFLARTGGRDEAPESAGISHFLEHMCFKGTAKRTWHDIVVHFDEMGSSYNAFTSKERTFYYGWVRKADIEQQMELIADMMRPALPAEEFDTEKNVILEEIAMSNDELLSLAYDLFHEESFNQGDAMGFPVLGYERTVKAMTHEQMRAYWRRRYQPGNMVLVVAGNVDPGRIVAAAGHVCGEWEPGGETAESRRPPNLRTPTSRKVHDRFNQQAIIMGYASPPAADELHESAEALAAILGRDNSRFFWNIVQKGIAPRAGAWREDYQDCGLFCMYGLCEPKNCERFVEAVRQEAKRISDDGVEPHEVQRVKNKRRTSLAREAEAPYYRLVQIMDDLDRLGRPRTVEERLAAVEAVSAQSIADYLVKYPITGEGSFVSVGPRDWPETAAS